MAGTASGAELVLRGVYQGRDIFVQNPYSREDQRFCTERVLVNDKEVITNPKTSAFKINLSHLEIRDIVVIRIFYREGCEPRIINPDVIQPVDGFEFMTAQASRQSISWLTKGELPGGKFYIEREEGNDNWIIVLESSGKGAVQSANYEVPVEHIAGINLYRIKYEGADGEENYSITFQYDFKEKPITFYINDVATKIYLSEETDYEISDINGRVYRRGRDRIISIQTLKPGSYILHIQDEEKPFIKK